MRETRLFNSLSCLAVCLALLVSGVAPTRAEMGPCEGDGHDSMICGNGAGAARVVEKTVSPSRRLALAWRSNSEPPTVEPSTSDTEDLVIRIRDGAILAKQDGDFWATPDGRQVRRWTEKAAWSPDSRILIRTFDARFTTENVDVFAFGADDKLIGPLDLRKIMEPALRPRLKKRPEGEAPWEFSTSGRRPFRIDNRGLVHATAMMWVPKNGPNAYFALTIQITRKGGALGAKILSIRPSREIS